MDELNSLKLSLSKNIISNDAQRIIDLVSTGNALLFVGAGFSKDSLNIDEKKPPLAADLSKKIGNLVVEALLDSLNEDERYEIANNKNLMFTSDLYLNNVANKNNLIDLLKRNYTIKAPSPSQIDICKLTWRRIYTTNYDNAIELSLAAAGKSCTSLDLTDSPQNYRDTKDICVHINGKLDKIKEDDFINRIKLSTSSYLSAEQFLDSAWCKQFKRDVENSSAVVFIGYSMYDIDVKKILFLNKHLIDKTFFITHPDASFESVYNLKTYGAVFKIGVEGFSQIAEKCNVVSQKENNVEMTFALSKFELKDDFSDYEIRDLDVNNFLLFGNVKDEYIVQAITKDDYTKKFIHRKFLSLISQQIISGGHLLITSDLGNGKTILTKVLMAQFTMMGYDCYLHLKNTNDLIKDVESINKSKTKKIIIVDDYSNVMDDVISLIELNYPNIQIVLTARYYGYESTKHKLLELDMSKFKIHNIDNLESGEVDQFVDIVHSLGAWGDKAGLPNEQKLRDLDVHGQYQLSVLLLTVLKSPFIKSKIDEVALKLFKSSKIKDTVFTILLLEVMGVKYDRASIADLSRNEEIYNPKFINDDGVLNIFRIVDGDIKAKSSTFAIFMLNNCFESQYITSKLLDVVSYLDSLPDVNKDDNYDDMKKSLLRFSLIEKILPKKRTEIKYFYEKVKDKVAWLTNDPHYWVQYAMAMIPFKDYVPAQTFIDSAYSLASKKPKGYHTNNIDTQQARLYLLRCLEANPQESFGLFKSADDLMKGIPNDIFKYRQIIKYEEVFKKKYPNFSKGDKVYFEQACKRVIMEAKQAIDNPIDFYANDLFITRVKNDFTALVSAIESRR